MGKSVADLVRETNAGLTEPGQTNMVGARDGESPRFEVYFAPFSVCSHKVRTVLLEKGIPFVAHRMNLGMRDDKASDSYSPAYVRMRLKGAPGAELVRGYTGQSSVASEGFDPCVVPTLFDHLHQRVVVDSARICDYLDRESDVGTPLVPDELASGIDAQISLIDQAPHVAVLYGVPPEGEDCRPGHLANMLDGVHDRKIVHLERIKASVADEPELVA
ncbi:MAG: glutathione S-transferase N-terminal domain-containing protein, partial [Pseudomonadota bacterium]